jgi:opacity protein-like surface antigen
MPYLTGGYANASTDFEVRTPAPGALGAAGGTVFQEQAHERLPGWYIGAGFEWAISPGWTTGIEYRHYEFDSRNTTAFSACATNGLNSVVGCQSGASAIGVPLETVRFSDTTDSITARVTWRWSREPTVAPPLK